MRRYLHILIVKACLWAVRLMLRSCEVSNDYLDQRDLRRGLNLIKLYLTDDLRYSRRRR